jgi:uncharacterized membrane protein
MDVDVITEIVIDRPSETVARYASDPDRVPDWYANIRSVEWRTERPLRIGSRLAFVAHFLGRRMAYTYEVTELSSTHLVMRTSEGPFPMETSYAWERIDDSRTRMTLRNRGKPTGFSKWLAPFMAVAIRHANRKDLMLLKRQLEGAGSGGSSRTWKAK